MTRFFGCENSAALLGPMLLLRTISAATERLGLVGFNILAPPFMICICNTHSPSLTFDLTNSIVYSVGIHKNKNKLVLQALRDVLRVVSEMFQDLRVLQPLSFGCNICRILI